MTIRITHEIKSLAGLLVVKIRLSKVLSFLFISHFQAYMSNKKANTKNIMSYNSEMGRGGRQKIA